MLPSTSKRLALPLALLLLAASCGDGESAPGEPRLVFTALPTTTDWGVTFATQPVVTIVDDDDVAIDTATAAVKLTLIDGNGAKLSDTTAVAAVGGVATFAGLSIDRPAANVRLVARTPGLRPDTSDVFTIGGPLPDRIVFTAEPDSGSGGETFPIQPAAEVRTAGGQVVPWYNGIATLTKSPDSPAGTLIGGLAVPVENGVVQFAAVEIDSARSGFKLVVSAPGLAADTTAPFDVVIGLMSTKSNWASFGGPLSVGDTLQIYIIARDLGGNRVTLIPDSIRMHRFTGDADGTFSAWEDTGAGSGSPGPYKTYWVATVAGTVRYRISHSLIPGPLMPGSITVNP
jgi:hypothetical protein